MFNFFGKYRDSAPLVLRIMLGLTFLFSHGYPKVTSPDRWERDGQAMANLGITFAPVFWGFMLGATEVVVGILFLVGLAVRPGALIAIFIMFVAALRSVVNEGSLFAFGGGSAHPIDYAAGAIALLLLGAGKYSIDRKIGWDK